MYRLLVRPEWSLKRQGNPDFPLPQVLRLVEAVHEGGSLAQAARKLGLSYRHAWGLIREADQAFGSPLIVMERGKGGQLTRLGEVLLWADRRIAARLNPSLDSLSSELSAEMLRVLSKDIPVRIQASHGFAVQILKESLAELNVDCDLRYTSSAEALTALVHQECEFAGFHIPMGELQVPALQPYLNALNRRPIRLIHLATRTQGLMVTKGNPLRIHSMKDLGIKGGRFVNRQPGSGTRYLIDVMLNRDRVNHDTVPGYEIWEYTHAAVAAYIASGMADVGFGIETAARQFNLDFIPLVHERYLFASLPEAENLPGTNRVMEILRSAELRHGISQLAGYDSSGCGEILSFEEAFEEGSKLGLLKKTIQKKKGGPQKRPSFKNNFINRRGERS
jgi:molybdate transport repressor ModE-like protein